MRRFPEFLCAPAWVAAAPATRAQDATYSVRVLMPESLRVAQPVPLAVYFGR